MGIVPDEVDYYEDDEGRVVVRTTNESSWLPSIDYYDDNERTIVKINNRKVIDHKKGNFFEKMVGNLIKPIEHKQQKQLQQKEETKNITHQTKQLDKTKMIEVEYNG